MKRIATYSDYRRAARAVQHLDEAGFDVQELRIVARDLARRPVRSGRAFSPFARDAILSALASAALTVVLLVVYGSWDGDGLLFGVVAVGSVVLGLAITALLHLGDGGAAPSRQLVPGSYTIECGARAPEAEHELARWWDTKLAGKPQTPRGYVPA